MADEEESKPFREDFIIWSVRILQLIFLGLVLWIAGTAGFVWKAGLECSIPSKLLWNLICAALTAIPLIYLIPTTGPCPQIFPWNRWAQFSLDVIFLILWISTSATSRVDCSDDCNACSKYYAVYGGAFDLHGIYANCTCIPGASASKRGLESSSNKRAYISSEEANKVIDTASEAWQYHAKIGFNGVLAFLFFVTLVYGGVGIINEHKKAKKVESKPEEVKNGLEAVEAKQEGTVNETSA